MNYNKFLTLATDSELMEEAKKLQIKVYAYMASREEKQAYTWILNELKDNRSIKL